MGKCVKRKFAMISADTTVANAPERKMIIRKMPGSIVYATTSKGNRFDPGFLLFGTGSKNIKRKRIWISTDDSHGLFHPVKAENREHRSKYFFLHQGGIKGDIFHNGRSQK